MNVEIERTDNGDRTQGWGMNLEIECCKNGKFHYEIKSFMNIYYNLKRIPLTIIISEYILSEYFHAVLSSL